MTLAPRENERAFAPPPVLTPNQRGDAVDLFFGLLIGFLLVGSGALTIADGESAAIGALIVVMGLGLVIATTIQRIRR